MSSIFRKRGQNIGQVSLDKAASEIERLNKTTIHKWRKDFSTYLVDDDMRGQHDYKLCDGYCWIVTINEVTDAIHWWNNLGNKKKDELQRIAGLNKNYTSVTPEEVLMLYKKECNMYDLSNEKNLKELLHYFYHLGAADGILKSIGGGETIFENRYDKYITAKKANE